MRHQRVALKMRPGSVRVCRVEHPDSAFKRGDVIFIVAMYGRSVLACAQHCALFAIDVAIMRSCVAVFEGS
jgi:hypothetical protein